MWLNIYFFAFYVVKSCPILFKQILYFVLNKDGHLAGNICIFKFETSLTTFYCIKSLQKYEATSQKQIGLLKWILILGAGRTQSMTSSPS